MLDSHPQILASGELFQDVDTPCHPKLIIPRYSAYVKSSFVRKIKNRFIRHCALKSYLDFVFSSYSFQAIGFKLMLNQLTTYPELLDYLRFHNFKVIHIVRNNFLKIHISRIRAKQTGLYVTRDLQHQNKITVPPESLLTDLDKIKNQNRQLCLYLDRMELNSYTVEYESLQQARANVLKKIMNFLNVDNSIVLSPKSIKITSDDLSKVIENYSEISSLLKNSEHERFLN